MEFLNQNTQLGLEVNKNLALAICYINFTNW